VHAANNFHEPSNPTNPPVIVFPKKKRQPDASCADPVGVGQKRPDVACTISVFSLSKSLVGCLNQAWVAVSLRFDFLLVDGAVSQATYPHPS
jgi:hypothetical protein